MQKYFYSIFVIIKKNVVRRYVRFIEDSFKENAVIKFDFSSNGTNFEAPDKNIFKRKETNKGLLM